MTLSRHSAPGTNAAFSYQFERALYWLTQSPAGSVIGVETDDDVAVHGENASRLLEQDKHSIRGGVDPFGDRSKDLWNHLGYLDRGAGQQRGVGRDDPILNGYEQNVAGMHRPSNQSRQVLRPN